jgi:DNA-binding response OmpR family regulator
MTFAPDVVAVFNTSPDTTDMLRIVLEHAGFVVVTAYTYDLRDGRIELETFMRQHQPKVLIYDIAIPYEQNWRLFQHFRQLPTFAAAKFVLTTTNAAQVAKIAGLEAHVHEIVGKPYDLDILVQAVKEAARQRPTE